MLQLMISVQMHSSAKQFSVQLIVACRRRILNANIAGELDELLDNGLKSRVTALAHARLEKTKVVKAFSVRSSPILEKKWFLKVTAILKKMCF